jgi:hypothetical protein
LEYTVLKPFQHIHGYKRPGDMAELSPEEAKKRLDAGEVKPGEAEAEAELIRDIGLETKPKRRSKQEVIEDEN